MTRSGLAAVVIAVAAVGVGPLAAESSAAAPGPEELLTTISTSDWTDAGTLDSTADVGTSVGVALEPATGVPWISYYDQTDDDVQLARYVGTGGTCGPSYSWRCMGVNHSHEGGSHNAIAAHYGGAYTEVIIVWHDTKTYSLKYAAIHCSGIGCSWGTHTIASGEAALLDVGRDPSVAYDPSGAPHIAYQTMSYLGDETVNVAHFVGGGGNCGEDDMVAGWWQCDSIMSGPGLGRYTSIVVDSSDRPRIAFYDSVAGYPYFAKFLGPDAGTGNCGPGNDWYCLSPYTSGHDTGQSASLYLDGAEAPHLAFLDTTTSTEKVIYASFVGSGGNCGFSSGSMQSEWQCDVIVGDVGDVGDGRTVAIAGDANGAPMIAYRDASSGTAASMLKLARPFSAVPSGTPNCGPIAGSSFTWVCTTLDIGGSWQEEAAGVAIAGGQGGTAIVYHELDTYSNPAEGNLKVLYERRLLFKDGFENGDTSAWSSQTQ